MSTLNIMEGEVLELLATIPEGTIQCGVTSPPYWGLRDYGIPPTKWPSIAFVPAIGLDPITIPEMTVQLGHEQDPWAFVAHIVHVFRAVHRTMRKDGTLWVNMGDSYSSKKVNGYQPKDLFGMPWKVANALQADGWILRRDVIWSKPNAMPESTKDRPATSHEYVFFFSKSRSYFYDGVAIMEPVSGNAHRRGSGVNPKVYIVPRGWDASIGEGGHGAFHKAGAERGVLTPGGKTPGKNSRIHVDRDPAHLKSVKPTRQNESFSAAVRGLVGKKNKRSVWSIPTFSFKEAHFATFPPKLAETCILAGTSARGCCPQCGAPWNRITENDTPPTTGKTESTYAEGMTANRLSMKRQAARERGEEFIQNVKTIGWKPSCKHEHETTVPCTVLDPFIGSGTVGLVSLQSGRNAIGCEINPKSIAIARRRCAITPELQLS